MNNKLLLAQPGGARGAALLLAVILVCAAALSGCGGGTLLVNNTPQALVLEPTGNGETVTFSYTIGQPAQVWVYLENAQGQRFSLRDGEARRASSDPYTLVFDGTAPTPDDPTIVRRALPGGEYTYLIRAQSPSGAESTSQGTLTIVAEDVQPPLPENLVVSPQTISPNADGVDDETEFTYQLPVTATVDLTVATPDGRVVPLITAEEQEPTPQRTIWNGRTSDGAVLGNGVYTYTLRTQDDYGTVAQFTGAITIQDSGQPEATITYSNIAPAAVELGGVITVTLRVKNTGDVPIRTYGPASGYEYSTNQVFSSVENGEFQQKAGGFWRVGMDWDANSGGGPKRYPFRWAISPRPPEQWKVPFQEDLLMPGEEAEIIGRIKIEQRETRMGFYVGLTWDGVGFRQDRIGRQIVDVGF